MASKTENRRQDIERDKIQIYIVGGGIAGLSASVFAIRDGLIPGKNIRVLEACDTLGGSMHYAGAPPGPYYLHAAWKVSLKSHQCMWDMLSAIPSLTDPNLSIKDEVLAFNRTHKKNAKSRLIDKNRNRIDIPKFGPLGLNMRDRLDILIVILAAEKRFENRRIDAFFAPSFFMTNFWKVFSSMFAIEKWNDLVEMKRYFLRYMHGMHNMGMGATEMVFPHTLHDSVVQPVVKWLRQQGVTFETGCKVTDIDFAPSEKELTVERIHCTGKEGKREIKLSRGDCVFITNGSMVADCRRGSMTEPAPFEKGKLDGSWTLWENIAKKRPGLGNPSVFTDRVEESMWIPFCVTCKDSTLIDLYEKFTGNKPGQADMVTFKDSNWHMSLIVADQPIVMNQPDDMYVFGGCGLTPHEKGNFVNKKMSECTGAELLTEMCHHFGFVDELPKILESTTVIPTVAPYLMSHFLPKKRRDRPPPVPEGSTNLAFMGQFVESGECVMLVESSVRSARIGVYSLLDVNRKVPTVFTSLYNPVVWLKMIGAAFN